MAIVTEINKRKSVRSYLDKPVSTEDLAAIVEAGRWAPNSGPFTISVISKAELIQRISDLTLEHMKTKGSDFHKQRAALPGYEPLYGAPALIIVSGPADAPNTVINAAVVVENMLLQATALGLGSCFIKSISAVLNNPQNQALAEEAGIPAGSTMGCGLIVGYTDDETKFVANTRELKGEVVYIG